MPLWYGQCVRSILSGSFCNILWDLSHLVSICVCESVWCEMCYVVCMWVCVCMCDACFDQHLQRKHARKTYLSMVFGRVFHCAYVGRNVSLHNLFIFSTGKFVTDHGIHASTPACDLYRGLKYDSTMSYIASIIAIFLLQPAVYTLAKVLVVFMCVLYVSIMCWSCVCVLFMCVRVCMCFFVMCCEMQIL